ncbi:MAG: hypothetical protein H0T41_08030 [Rhodobacteraceae bacterium]|nr:hypothetical protein [Paracoccaceae bacterium]
MLEADDMHREAVGGGEAAPRQFGHHELGLHSASAVAVEALGRIALGIGRLCGEDLLILAAPPPEHGLKSLLRPQRQLVGVRQHRSGRQLRQRRAHRLARDPVALQRQQEALGRIARLARLVRTVGCAENGADRRRDRNAALPAQVHSEQQRVDVALDDHRAVELDARRAHLAAQKAVGVAEDHAVERQVLAEGERKRPRLAPRPARPTR